MGGSASVVRENSGSRFFISFRLRPWETDGKPLPGGRVRQTVRPDPQAHQQLANDGHFPKGANGKYALVPTIKGYIRFLKTRHGEGNDWCFATPGESLARPRATTVRPTGKPDEDGNQRQGGGKPVHPVRSSPCNPSGPQACGPASASRLWS
ncbi:hypothetical protein SAMN02949497_2590 [Methylomagnum ishizawai]|uniref:Uncharacterized protein n=1 Tax=Methylomagnum ishizawai TaxID=1760988 RepID=A0A1Y6CXY8_9GAMM|nr:hypothetical protein SAMN02949497_2590 [Methylomagnum ishizawai]